MDWERQEKQGFEDFLLNDKFYSSPSGSAGHIHNLRKSVYIPNSISSSSVNAPLMGGEPSGGELAGGQTSGEPSSELSGQQKTTMMRNSPSMKALEKILVLKNSSLDSTRPAKIVEEQEEEQEEEQKEEREEERNAHRNYNASVVSFDQPNGDPQTFSAVSLQTYQTATNSVSELRPDAAESRQHQQFQSISTIEEGYSVEDETPKLLNPAQFEPLRHVNGINGTLANPVKLINEPSNDSDEQLTKVSNQTIDNDTLEQEETLFDSENDQRTRRDSNKKTSGPGYRNSTTLSPDDFAPEAHPKAPTKTKSMIPPDIEVPKVPQKQVKQQSTTTEEPSKPSQGKENSPELHKHSRSHSTFSLSFNRNKEQPDIPKQRQRKNNTLGDISGITNTQEKPLSSKKFSFKNFFKIKSKRTKDEDISIPKKIKSKSYSSPSLSAFGRHKEEPHDNSEISKPAKKERSKKHVEKASPPLPNLQAEDVETPDLPPKHLVRSKTDPNILGLGVMRDSEFDDYQTSSFYDEDSDKTKTSKHLSQIRVVSDDEDYIFGTVKLGNDPMSNFDDLSYPPSENFIPTASSKSNIGNLSNGVESSPKNTIPRLDSISRQLQLESPLDLNYSPIDLTLDLDENEVASERERLRMNDGKHIPTRVNDLLLGETLFPRSLSQQEVNSIVSLERSRSLKSARDVKRNSFINYNGSDDNVVQFDGAPLEPTLSMTRSNSILKNSKQNSRRNLRVAEMNPEEEQPQVEDLGDSMVDDLIEFTDFIDFDNLETSFSPSVAGMSFMELVSDKSPVHGKSHNTTGTFSSNESNEMGTRPDMPIVVDESTIQELDSQDQASASQNQPLANETQKPSITNMITPPPSQSYEGSSKADNHVEKPANVNEDASEAAVAGLLTPNLEVISPHKFPNSPDSFVESPGKQLIESVEEIDQSWNNAEFSGRSKSVNNRPISMSFKGLRGPSFAGKLVMHDVRSSESHQSFDISFPDESEGNSNSEEIDTVEVGGGFGSSDDDDEEEEDEEYEEDDDDGSVYDDDDVLNEQEYQEDEHSQNLFHALAHRDSKQLVSDYKEKGFNSYNDSSILESHSSAGDRSSSYLRSYSSGQVEDDFSALPPPPSMNTFTHNKIPSISSTNSSPRSLSSMFSRRLKWSPHVSGGGLKVVSPTVNNKGGVKFSSRIILYDTYNGEEYDRHPDSATCNQLTPGLAQQIKDELNQLKREWDVHHESRCYTHFL